MVTKKSRPVYIPSIEKSNILNAIAEPGITRDGLAPSYVACIISDPTGKAWDVAEVNKAIIAKWSVSGLTYIKEAAWKSLQHRKSK